MPRSAAFVDEIANELATWPGVRIERRTVCHIVCRGRVYS